MDPRWRMLFLVFLFSVAIATDVSDNKDPKAEAMKSEAEDKEHPDQEKAKRSQEEIMFGNQQNKPAGLVDDLLVMPEGKDIPATQDESAAKNTTESQGDGLKVTESSSDDHNPVDSRPKPNGPYDYYELLDDKENNQYQDPSFDYTAPRIPSQVSNQEGLLNSQLYELQDLGEYPSYRFSNEVYRRKRTALNHTPLKQPGKLRSLPMNKDYRRCRLFRCPPRPKRQVSVEDFLTLLGMVENNERNDEYPQVPDKFLLPVEVSDTVNYDLPYPYALAGDTAEEEEVVLPNNNYLRAPPPYEIRIPPLQREREEIERVPVAEWMLRSPPPSVTNSVTRRTAPYLYPQDYRFIPGHKKRSRDRDSRNLLEQGRWGRPVQVPEAYATAEDVARLYTLAKLLAETEDME